MGTDRQTDSQSVRQQFRAAEHWRLPLKQIPNYLLTELVGCWDRAGKDRYRNFSHRREKKLSCPMIDPRQHPCHKQRCARNDTRTHWQTGRQTCIGKVSGRKADREIDKNTHSVTRSLTHTHTHAHAHTEYTRTHAHARPKAHTQAHARTHARTHAHTHTHTHTH